MKKFNYAILRTPSQSAQKYIVDTEFDFKEFVKEHETLTHFLKNIPIRVHNLPSVKDDIIGSKINPLCIATERCVILGNFDENIVNNQKLALTAHLSRFYPLDKIFFIDYPGILSSRDILEVDKTFFVSLSNWTNQEGVNQFIEFVRPLGYEVITITNSQDSLQNYLNYVSGNNLLVKDGYEIPQEFDVFNKVVVPVEESSAIGALWVNETIILPNECVGIKEYLIELNRYRVLSIATPTFNQIQAMLKEYVILF
ncbi:hypothetical protein D8X55_01735 [Malacoplasma penetrans]|uniref:hypothetical protein n=1 Tax=Malacoplasma penetrans TaxID=28227 RepID=UPI001010746C|nr:hypothetical protein [Malacoplasma penetrans]RXY96995.1 hypothetical protein D8X55_01735 [Malacoplasma penetrans]